MIKMTASTKFLSAVSIVFVLFLLSSGTAFGQQPKVQYLGCDLYPEGSLIAAEVEINGIIYPGLTPPRTSKDGTATLLIDLDALNLPGGDYTFKAQVQGVGGFWSGWGVDPLDVTKPGGVAGLGVIRE